MSWRTCLFSLALQALAPIPAQGQNRDSLTYVTWSLDPWAKEAMQADSSGTRYELFLGLNPYYQRGDFDGDGQTDVAVQVREKSTGKRGIAIIHRSDRSVHIVGAGRALGNGGDDFSWLWVWRVDRPEHLRSMLQGGREALYLSKPEAASGWIIWNGRSYVWVQAGD